MIPLPFLPSSPEQRLALIDWQRQIREAALEEAADICDDMPITYERGGHYFNTVPEDYAAAVRRAKGKE